MNRNEQLFSRAQQRIPGGVNSPVRAFRAVGGCPLFFERGAGAYLWDANGKSYIDYVGSWGPAVLGHAHPAVVKALQQRANLGLSFGAPTALEIELAELICKLLPSIEMVRLVSSGTEATMSAIRLARGYTGRSKIIKFEGCYHGHGDSLLVKAGSGALTLGQPSSAGVPAEIAGETLVLTYNDLDEVQQTFAQRGEEIAGVIVEPIAGNMNLVLPKPGFLEGLRRCCDRYAAVLIFDEVMTGFRVGLQGAQGLYQINPDLTTLGKIVGGGMPLAAFGGKRSIMERLAPLGPVYQAGTLSGNPIAVAAGLATLQEIQQPDFYSRLNQITQSLVDQLVAAAQKRKISFSAQAVGGMFGLYFSEVVPQSYAAVMNIEGERFKRFFHGMLECGVYFAPSAYEAGFVSAAHTHEQIDFTAQQADTVFAKLEI